MIMIQMITKLVKWKGFLEYFPQFIRLEKAKFAAFKYF